jgi:integrase
MARRRFQNPKPRIRGNWWTIRIRRDDFVAGERKRVQTDVRIAPATMSAREAQKVANEYIYVPIVMPLLAKSTQERYQGIMDNYLLPTFGKLCLRDLTALAVQRYFSSLASSNLSHESRDKIRDVLSSALGSAVQYGLLISNPVENVRMPAERRGRRMSKDFIYPEKFDELVSRIPEPYATMVYDAIYTGLRVSELAGLRWNDVHQDSITIDERFCRGDWGAPKSEASNATIAVNGCVVERIHRLKLLTVEVRAGLATRRYRVVKSDGPNDLVFQSVKDG